jgi:hypothetical protein
MQEIIRDVSHLRFTTARQAASLDMTDVEAAHEAAHVFVIPSAGEEFLTT